LIKFASDNILWSAFCKYAVFLFDIIISATYFENKYLFGNKTSPLHSFITFYKNYSPITESNKATVLPSTNPIFILYFTSNLSNILSFIYKHGFISKALKKFTLIIIFGFDNQAKRTYVLLSFPITQIWFLISTPIASINGASICERILLIFTIF